MKYNFLIFGIALSIIGLVAQAQDNNGRYKSYSLEPNYTQVLTDNILSEQLVDGLRDWYGIERLNSIATDSHVLALYRIQIKEERRVEQSNYVAHKEVILKQKLTDDDRGAWDEISVVNSKGEKSILAKSPKRVDFFSSSHNGLDYYGCIEKKPVFTADLIENRPAAAFVITGSGDMINTEIYDDITLRIYSSGGKLYAKEPLFIANYAFATAPIVDGTIHSRAANRKANFNGLLATDNYGRRQFSKLYIDDFDEDDKLEMVFWQRIYRSTDSSEDPQFKFHEESFVAYKENAEGNGFELQKIPTTQGHQWLEDSQQTWDTGYPQNNDQCSEDLKKYPMMMGVKSFEK